MLSIGRHRNLGNLLLGKKGAEFTAAADFGEEDEGLEVFLKPLSAFLEKVAVEFDDDPAAWKVERANTGEFLLELFVKLEEFTVTTAYCPLSSRESASIGSDDLDNV